MTFTQEELAREELVPPSELQLSSTAKHRVVVVGSGFGGLFATRRLRGAPVEVTVIDRTTHHLFQPLLYQVATGILSGARSHPRRVRFCAVSAMRMLCWAR